jgi:hypothetical protein
MKTFTFSLTLYLLIATNFIGRAQGCSDSGFCTMGAMRPDQPYAQKVKIKLHSIELTQHLGHTKFGDWVHATFIDANFSLGRKNFFQLRLPSYAIIEGNMPTVRGWGDTFFSFTRQLVATEQFQVNATLGGKIYTSMTQSDDAMPLYQQTTLGSNDLMMGVSMISKKWMVAVGYQKPLNGTRNNFNPTNFEGSVFEDVAKNYTASAGLYRGDDIALRVERNFRLARWNFFIGSLNLIRVTADQRLDSEGKLTAVEGSTGLASNILIGGGYQFNIHSGIRLLVAGKLTERAQNPDGLSRDFVAQLAYVVRF